MSRSTFWSSTHLATLSSNPLRAAVPCAIGLPRFLIRCEELLSKLEPWSFIGFPLKAPKEAESPCWARAINRQHHKRDRVSVSSLATRAHSEQRLPFQNFHVSLDFLLKRLKEDIGYRSCCCVKVGCIYSYMYNIDIIQYSIT